jgi:hypothetical protein
MVESIVASAIDKALETVLRKVGEGKKLSTEDLVVLMLGLFQEIRKDVTETNKRIDAINDSLSRRIEETNKRIDEVNMRIDELGKGMSEMRESINRRIDETNKRIDTLYDLLGKIYEALIKQATTQRQ